MQKIQLVKKGIFTKTLMAASLATILTGCTNDPVSTPSAPPELEYGSSLLNLSKTTVFGNAHLYGSGNEDHWHGQDTIAGFGYTYRIQATDGVGWFFNAPAQTELRLEALVENTMINQEGTDGGELAIELYQKTDFAREDLISSATARWTKYARRDNAQPDYNMVWDQLDAIVDIPSEGDYLLVLRPVKNSPAYERSVSLIAEVKLHGHGFDELVQYEAPSTRGAYFTLRTEYVPTPLPTFDDSKDLLPRPILEGNPEWVNMYWNTWKFAFQQLRTVHENNKVFVSNYVDEAFNDWLFQWDIQMMIQFWRYGNNTFPAIETQDNFYRAQHLSGMIYRMLSEIDGRDHSQVHTAQVNPPMFAWMELLWAKSTGDTSRFEHVIPAIVKKLEYIEANHKEPTNKENKHNLYWNNGQGNGMDSLPRANGPMDTRDVASVDISAQVSIEYDSLAQMARHLDDEEMAREFEAKRDEINRDIDQLWSEDSNFYVDLNPDGSIFKDSGRPGDFDVLTLAASWPLMIGDKIPDNEARAGKMLETLYKQEHFNQPFPLNVLDASHSRYSPGHYDFGGVMTPLAFVTTTGLKDNGYYHEAAYFSERIMKAVSDIFRGGTHYWTNLDYVPTYPEWKDQRICTIWEMYKPTKQLDNFDEFGTHKEIFYHNGAEGNRRSVRPQFVGWSGIYPITTLIEQVMGFSVDALENTITWNIRRNDRHGIEQLKVGEATVNLVASERDWGDDVEITASTDKDITLIVHHRQDDGKNDTVKTKEVLLKAGETTTFTVEGAGEKLEAPHPVYTTTPDIDENCANYELLIKDADPVPGGISAR